MRKSMWAFFVAAGTCALLPQPARAAMWIESTNGDLSGNRQSPSALNLTFGSNTVTATVGSGDVDYLRVNVPAGTRLQSLFLRSYSGNDGVAFIGLQQGTTFTESPSTAGPEDMLGYTHFGTFAGNVGEDLLPQMATAFGAQGFTPPLTGSSYTFWIQQLGPSVGFTLDAVVTPEPGSAVLLGCAGGVVLLRRRRFAHQHQSPMQVSRPAAVCKTARV